MAQIPQWGEVLYHTIRSENVIENFNRECDCNLIFHQLPDLVNNHRELKGEERLQIDLLVDYIINFVYLPIIYTRGMNVPFGFIAQKDY